jgi:hypothetical protein
MLLSAIVLLCGASIAQTSTDDWRNVERLLPGVEIAVTGPSSKLRCTLLAATDDNLTCAPIVHWRRRGTPSEISIPRANIRELRLVHSEDEQRSAGTAGGAIAGAIIGTVGGIAGGPPRAARVLIAAPLLAAIGAGIGGLTHPLGSTVVYRKSSVKKSKATAPGSPAVQTIDRSVP